ncbi:MAG TPA: hypothetical protein VFC51_07665 [Chloroflexota bacterium]|nr:hypothetical protein [Chloroflexota bacterium]
MARPAGPLTGAPTSVLDRLREAASPVARQPGAALAVLTGQWSQARGAFSRAEAHLHPRRNDGSTWARAKTIYLDDAAEADLHFLVDLLQRAGGPATRSQAVRRALRATRLALERDGLHEDSAVR